MASGKVQVVHSHYTNDNTNKNSQIIIVNMIPAYSSLTNMKFMSTT